MVAIPSPHPQEIDITFNGSRIQQECLRIMIDPHHAPTIHISESTTHRGDSAVEALESILEPRTLSLAEAQFVEDSRKRVLPPIAVKELPKKIR